MVFGELNALSCLAETTDPPFSSLLDKVLWMGEGGILSPSINLIDNILRVLDNQVSITGERPSALYLIPYTFGFALMYIISFSSMSQFLLQKEKDSVNSNF